MKVSKKLKEKIEEKYNLKKSKYFYKNFFDSCLRKYIDNDGKPTSKLIFDFNYDEFLIIYKCLQNKFLLLKLKHKTFLSLNGFRFFSLKKELENFKNKFEVIHEFLRDNFGKQLQEENQIFICPYCQRNYIGIFEKKDPQKGYVAPDLDHFYPKSKYPFLAATISNLIPACSVCNQRIKKDKDPLEEGLSNPLEENIFEKIEFNFNNSGPYICNWTKLGKREKDFINFFKIQEQYSIHTEIVNEIQVKRKKYNRVKKCDLKKCCPSLSEEIIEYLVFHEYKYIDKKKTPLWKLKKDIYQKLRR